MKGRGKRQEGKRRFLALLLSSCLFLLPACSPRPAPQSVWIDVARLAPLDAPARTTPPLPKPPTGLPARTASLPARPPARLVAEAGIDGEALARAVDEAQAESLARLRRRLSEVYRREGDRFARAGLRELGDPYRKAIDKYYPEYRKAFEAYAERRVAPASQLAFIVGQRDPNPDDAPTPGATLTPLGRLLAARATKARRELRALNREFNGVIQAFLANVEREGTAMKAATLAAIEAKRDALNRQALAEAALPIGPRGEAAIRLSLARSGVALVPAVPARSVVLPALAAPPPAPRVESPQALVDARARLLGEARIWAAGQGLRLDPKGRDATPGIHTMEKPAGWSLAELADALGGALDGPPDHRVLRPAPADEDDPDGLAFAEGAYVERAMASRVGAVIVPPDAPATKPAIRHPRPRQAFGRFLALVDRPLPLERGVSDRASVSPLAQIDPTARIGAFAVVEAGATVGPNARVYPFAYVGESCAVGEGATLHPHAVLVKNVTVGPRSVVHPGAVLGADGFGFAWDGKRQVKIPQVGSVEVGPDVEIGANAAIDRATAGATRVAEGVKLDNLVQVGHNTRLGAHTVVASLTGISGSTSVGARCTLAGQVGMVDHITIADDVMVGGKSGVTKGIGAAGRYAGFPAQPFMDEMRLQATLRRLPSLLKRLAELEKRVAELEG